MLTDEQIKNLKPGDTIFLNNYPLTFRDSNIHGDVLANDNVAECNEGGICWFSKNYLSIDNATPKYDPCRPFKKGDVVTPRKRNGRLIAAAKPLLRDKNYVVTRDEKTNCLIYFSDGDDEYAIDPAYLELVTPVEELEPYTVHSIVGDNGKTAFFAVRKGDVTVAAFFCDTPRAFTEEQALAAAEAERDRLTAEYRKVHTNG